MVRNKLNIINLAQCKRNLYITVLSSDLPSFLLPELMISDRHQKREIRQLEQELPRWQVLVDSITGIHTLPHRAQADVCYTCIFCSRNPVQWT